MIIFHRAFVLVNFIFKLKNVRLLTKSNYQELVVLAQVGERYLRTTRFGATL